LLKALDEVQAALLLHGHVGHVKIVSQGCQKVRRLLSPIAKTKLAVIHPLQDLSLRLGHGKAEK
jgi:hypothetical protein